MKLDEVKLGQMFFFPDRSDQIRIRIRHCSYLRASAAAASLDAQGEVPTITISGIYDLWEVFYADGQLEVELVT